MLVDKKYMEWYRKELVQKLCAFIVGIVVVVTPTLYERFTVETRPSNTLRVVFFDIGQGDAIFIQTPSGKQVLIDGGPDATVLRRLGKEMGFFDRTIDMVIATHEDRDHVGGLPDVFNSYTVGTFVRTENQGQSMEAHTIDNLSKRESSEIVYARRGMTFDFGASTTLRILFPASDPSMLEANTSSIVAKLTYGNESFIFTGDSPQTIEKYLLSVDKNDLKANVLKLGHHGSRTSSSREYLEAVRPEYGVVSSGKNNRYGHPHKEVVDFLHELGINMLNTAVEGNIVFETDGKTLMRK